MVKYRSCYKLIQWFVILSAASSSNGVTINEALLAKSTACYSELQAKASNCFFV